MLSEFKIKGFRCFKDFRVSSLRRVNVFSGLNNSGKTSLLEALFLYFSPHNSQNFLRINGFRGIEQMSLDYDILFGGNFFNFDTSQNIILDGSDDNDLGLSYAVHFRTTPSVSLIMPQDLSKPSSVDNGKLKDMEIILKTEDHQEFFCSRLTMTGNGLKTESNKDLAFQIKPGIFLSTAARIPAENQKRFSDLSRKGNQGALIDALKILEPRIKALEILEYGGTPLIHGDIGIGTKIPLQYMGDGILRLLSILLAISDAPKGVVLVDELDSGLHYTALESVWKAIGKAASDNDVQVFATTHSRECVMSGHKAFSEKPDDFSFFRVDVDEDRQTRSLVPFDTEALEGALQFGYEVR